MQKEAIEVLQETIQNIKLNKWDSIDLTDV